MMAGRPHRIHIRGIDEIEAGAGQGIQHLEGLGLGRGPTKNIAAETQGGNPQGGAAQRTMLHRNLLIWWG